MSSRSATWSTAAFIIGLLVAAVALTMFASTPMVRYRIDATKSRAYSLSRQTLDLLGKLEGDWTMAVVLAESQADPATVRQVDEVLARFSQANERLEVQRIDPTRPDSLRAYEKLLIDLQDRYQSEIQVHESAIADAMGSFRGLIRFAGSTAGPMRELSDKSPAAIQSELVPRVGAMSLLAGQGMLVIEEIERTLRVDESRPLPDFARAGSILSQALSQWAEELDDTARVLLDVGSVEAGLLGDRCSVEAARLAIAADRINRLPGMELSRIGHHLQAGEAAIVLGPGGAAVVPAGQLFSGTVSGSMERVSFDRRFRGEQLLAAAVRSLFEGVDPTVVFVHAEDRSMLQPSQQNIDVSGAAAMLEAARTKVKEWPVTTEPRPLVMQESPTVWIVLAPARRTGLKPSQPEMALLRATSDLLAEGEPVLVSLYPSLLPRYGQADPWAELVRPLGIVTDTGGVISETRRSPEGVTEARMVQVLTEFTEPHPIAAALHGQSLAMPLPVPVEQGQIEAGTSVNLMASVAPLHTRWLESDWSPRDDEPAVRGEAPALDRPLPLVAAVDRPSPSGDSRQRVLVVGSGGWMLNYVADMVMPTGGERYALLYPGNHELLLSGTAWLANLDNRIAPGPLSQEVARLGSITEPVRRRWAWFLLLGLPNMIALVGIVVWMMRRA